MSAKATLTCDGKSYELPVVVGTEDERALDIEKLRGESGLITLDDGYGNTGSCLSNITFIDGEQGILRYRGYPIEQLAEHATFVETAYLIIFGELPTTAQLAEFRNLLIEHMFIHEAMRHHFEGFPPKAPPMAILSAMINTLGCFETEFTQPEDDTGFLAAAARLMSKVRTIAAAAYKKSIGDPIVYPRFDLGYTAGPGPCAAVRGAGIQGCCCAIPDLCAGRLRRRADTGFRIAGFGAKGRDVRSDAADFLCGVRELERNLVLGDLDCRGAFDVRGEFRSAGADEREEDAGLFLDRARGIHFGGIRGQHEAGNRGCDVLSGGLRADEAGSVCGGGASGRSGREAA